MNVLAALTAQWLEAKAAEAKANATRVAVEMMIAAELPAHGPEDTRKAELDGFRVAVRYGVTRKVDTEKLQAMWDELPAKAQEAFKWKADVSLPKLRMLQEFMPVDFAKLAAAIETKPAKPSISVEVVEKAAA